MQIHYNWETIEMYAHFRINFHMQSRALRARCAKHDLIFPLYEFLQIFDIIQIKSSQMKNSLNFKWGPGSWRSLCATPTPRLGGNRWWKWLLCESRPREVVIKVGTGIWLGQLWKSLKVSIWQAPHRMLVDLRSFGTCWLIKLRRDRACDTYHMYEHATKIMLPFRKANKCNLNSKLK